MLELPKVEVTRLGLLSHITGQRIVRAVVHRRNLRWPVGPALPELLAGLAATRLLHRDKYLLIECVPEVEQSGRTADTVGGWLLTHLGVMGTLRALGTPMPPDLHGHIDIELADTTGVRVTLRYHDSRWFDTVLWHAGDETGLTEHLLPRDLSIEPFGARFDSDWMSARTCKCWVAIELALLAGGTVVDVGSIYCSESLSRAGIWPTMAAGRTSRPYYTALANAIRVTLTDAVMRGDNTLRDFVGSDGQSDYFRLEAFVYDRTGLPCCMCGIPIRQIMQGQRSALCCPARRC